MDKWARENMAVFALLGIAATLAAFIFLTKADAATTYATKDDVQYIDKKLDRILERLPVR